jgi:hypothetical protein
LLRLLPVVGAVSRADCVQTCERRWRKCERDDYCAASVFCSRNGGRGGGRWSVGRFALMWETGSLALHCVGRPELTAERLDGRRFVVRFCCLWRRVFLIEWSRSWGVALIHASWKFHLGNLRSWWPTIGVGAIQFALSIRSGRFPLVFDVQSSVFASDDWSKTELWQLKTVVLRSLVALFAGMRPRMGRSMGE